MSYFRSTTQLRRYFAKQPQLRQAAEGEKDSLYKVSQVKDAFGPHISFELIRISHWYLGPVCEAHMRRMLITLHIGKKRVLLRFCERKERTPPLRYLRDKKNVSLALFQNDCRTSTHGSAAQAAVQPSVTILKQSPAQSTSAVQRTHNNSRCALKNHAAKSDGCRCGTHCMNSVYPCSYINNSQAHV